MTVHSREPFIEKRPAGEERVRGAGSARWKHGGGADESVWCDRQNTIYVP